jgi:release factor glutamine methyltransferase
MTKVYEAREDSYFFCEFLKSELLKVLEDGRKNRELRFLDMGCGSGVIAKCAEESGIGVENIVCVDINKEAVRFAKEKGFKVYHSDLFEGISQEEKFDIICFNAPYLGEDKYEEEDDKMINCGGKRGDEISLRFVKEARNYLKKEGKIFLLISSITPFESLKRLNPKVCAKKRIFFEELIILEFS